MNAGGPANARAVAADIIRRWLETGDFPDRMLEPVTTDRGFVMDVVYGAVKRRRELEWVLGRCSKRMPEPPLRAHILVGLYQLLHMDRVETYAAVNETVAAVKAAFPPAQAGFANAVLRRAAREKDALMRELARQPLAVRDSHPDDLVYRWRRAFGDDGAAALCAWDNQPAAVMVRVRSGGPSMAAFLARLAGEGIRAEAHPFDPARFCTLPRGVTPERIPGFREGALMIQDPSTLVAVDLLDPQPGERILDACAAPGGKTVAIAERLAGNGTLIAMDLHDDRLRLLRETLRRTGLERVTVVQGDLTTPGPGPGPDLFDAILLDVPCMNTGVLRRRPDARWRFSLERMKKVASLQRAILNGAAGRVRPGGRIVYSTCSLEPEEDERLVSAWLRHRAGFALVRQRKVLPHVDGVDGAYAALIECREPPRAGISRAEAVP